MPGHSDDWWPDFIAEEYARESALKESIPFMKEEIGWLRGWVEIAEERFRYNQPHAYTQKTHYAYRLLFLFLDRMILALYRKNCDKTFHRSEHDHVRFSVELYLPEVSRVMALVSDRIDPEYQCSADHYVNAKMNERDLEWIQKSIQNIRKVADYAKPGSRYGCLPSTTAVIDSLDVLCATKVEKSDWRKHRQKIVDRVQELRKFRDIMPEKKYVDIRPALRRACELARYPLGDVYCDETVDVLLHKSPLQGRTTVRHRSGHFLDQPQSTFWHPHKKDRAKERFQRGFEIWRKIYEEDDEGVVLPLWGFCKRTFGLLQVTLFTPCTLGSVVAYIAGRPDADRLLLLVKMARCVRSIHARNVVLGTLDGATFQVMEKTGQPEIFLSKFYNAQFISDSGLWLPSSAYPETQWTTAPECDPLSPNSYDKQADIWPLGALIIRASSCPIFIIQTPK
ncbi:hypothetical protein PUNSTDRAFT_145547 [Punctularia strigosozonata HHB-11173 SS5]|uniref:uncharacterized protein n=1 Tax=Punctularia strigosozonata (strain HHB-11173) TaxID=741275 RepID=UPI0004417EC1|nr:uncharacterized protein PUNSTDRAFT_145547 [Punctularia strigosozonata HHB-11173 SS5]EIN06255.1 hypothetical protein PUNSTDRAFT_145547 [Punctularia strigosozonata HHB-11173 SS5]